MFVVSELVSKLFHLHILSLLNILHLQRARVFHTLDLRVFVGNDSLRGLASCEAVVFDFGVSAAMLSIP